MTAYATGHGMDMSALPPLDWHVFFTTWHFAPGWTAFAVVALCGYVYALRRAHALGHRVSVLMASAWVAGLVVLVYTVSSAVDAYVMALFWVHMIEHLMLIMVVPALLVLGQPLTVIRNALDDAGQERFDRVMHSLPLTIVTNPVFGFAVYTVVIVYTHLGGFMDKMAMNPGLMGWEQIAYVVSGYLYLLTLLGREPIRLDLPPLGRIAALLIGMTPDTVVGIVLMQSDSVVMPTYFAMRPHWAKPALADQYLGGSVMWALGDGIMMVLCLIAMTALLTRHNETRLMGNWLEGVRDATLRDHVASTGVELGEGVEADDDAALVAYNEMLARLGRHE